MNSAFRLLLLEDCVDTGTLIKAAVKLCNVTQCLSIAEAKLYLASEQFDLIIIDVELPDGSGFDYCHMLSMDPVCGAIPKILLTGRADVSDKVYGFSCGAIDYVTKPFSPAELKARVEAHLRLAEQERASLIISNIEFDVEFQRCYSIEPPNKINLNLTPTEFRLLYLLARNRGQVLTREILENLIWKTSGVKIEKRGIDSHMAHLRQKLGEKKELVHSVYGKGYAFRKE